MTELEHWEGTFWRFREEAARKEGYAAGRRDSLIAVGLSWWVVAVLALGYFL